MAGAYCTACGEEIWPAINGTVVISDVRMERLQDGRHQFTSLQAEGVLLHRCGDDPVEDDTAQASAGLTPEMFA